MLSLRRVAAVTVYLAVVAGSLRAQRLTGEIRLEVTDPTGAPMPASGRIESFAAGIDRQFRTDGHGLRALTGLPFGNYRLDVRQGGFAPWSELIEVRSEIPLTRRIALSLAPTSSRTEVRGQETLLNPAAGGAIQNLGAGLLEYRNSSAPGRSVIDLVDQQPGWLVEASGVLHPRGSEYDTQYVIDGVPLYDNRSPAFAQTLGIEEFETMTVRTANFPAEFGRKLGGVVEVNTARDPRPGLHGQASLQGGSFDQMSGYASLRYLAGSNSFGISGEGMLTDRYLDPPVLANSTNHASGGALSARFDRDWSLPDSTRFYFASHRTGFLVPNELLQEAAGQRQDRTAAETMGQVSHTHLFSASVIGQARLMIRDTSARLWSNPLSTPIQPDQARGFREIYWGGSLAWVRGAHALKAGADAAHRSIQEDFGFRIVARRLQPGNVRVFDSDIPAVFRFGRKSPGNDQSFFAQDTWHRGGLTLSGGLRFDHYSVVADETAWSPRLGAAYHVASAGLVLRASYDRIFTEPALENLLLASSDLAATLGGGLFLPLKPARGDYLEAGFSKSLGGRLRLDGTWYRRAISNFSDDSLLFNTGVSFPIAFRKARIHGYEAKLEVPRWGMFSGYASYSNMNGTGYLPVAGGLLLGDDAAAALEQGSFPITQDQRNTLRSRLRVEPRRRLWFAFGGSYNSGLPFEINGPANLDFVRRQYGPAIIGKVNFDRGRVRPSASLDASAGVSLCDNEHGNLRLQGDVFNLADRLNLINFSGLLSGTALAAGRGFAIRLNLGF